MKLGRTKRSRLLAILMALAMCLSVLFVSVGAVSGSQVAADGTYTATGTSRIDKDDEVYYETVRLTIQDGKVTGLTASGAGTEDNQSYESKAVKGIQSQIVGREATANALANIDTVSKATKSSNSIISGIQQAIASAPAAQSATNTYLVTFNMNGRGSQVSAQAVEEGNKATRPTDPSANGYTFDGWYSDSALTTLYSFNSNVTSNLTLYAKWTANSETPEIPDSGSETDKEIVIITNTPAANGNSIYLKKTVSFDETTESYTITLESYATVPATSGETTYKVHAYDYDYSYSELCSGNYYYLYKGTYYQVHGLKYYSNDKGEYYYCGYFVKDNTRYYLDKYPEPYTASQLDKEHPGDDKAKKAYQSCKRDKVDEGKELPLYKISGQTAANAVDASAVLRDYINAEAFDLTKGYTISTSAGTASLSSNGTLSVTGYDYSGNYGKNNLVVTVKGLKTKVSAPITFDVGTAAVYKTSSASSPLVAVESPTIQLKEKVTDKYSVTAKDLTYTLGDPNHIDGAGGPWGTSGKIYDTATPELEKMAYAYIDMTLIKNGAAVDLKNAGEYTEGGDYQFEFVSADEKIAESEANDAWIVLPGNVGSTKVTLNVWARNGEKGDVRSNPNAKLIATTTFNVNVVAGTAKATFKNYDGKVLEEKDVKIGDTVTYTGDTPNKPADAQYTYTFTGWSPALGTASEDTEYVAQYRTTVRSYTVTFYDEDGKTVLQTVQVPYGSTPTYTGSTPTKTDATGQYSYTFSGWSPALKTVTGATSYKATYTDKVTGYHIIVEDWTGKKATTSIDADAFYSGSTTFTVTSSTVCALGIHEDGSQATLNSKDGTYTRLRGTKVDDQNYKFTVDVTDHDVYIVLVAKGDATLDGRTNLRDATAINKAYANMSTLTNLANFAADANGDGRTNLRDATAINKAYAELSVLTWDIN